MPTPVRFDHARFGRVAVGLALLGFGIENVLFGHYVVARAAPWPEDPTAQFAVACATAAVFLASGAALLAGRVVRQAGLASAALILGWMLVRHLPVALAGPAWSGDWTNVLKAATLAAGALAIAVSDGRPVGRPLSALRTHGALCRRGVLPPLRHPALHVRDLRQDAGAPVHSGRGLLDVLRRRRAGRGRSGLLDAARPPQRRHADGGDGVLVGVSGTCSAGLRLWGAASGWACSKRSASAASASR